MHADVLRAPHRMLLGLDGSDSSLRALAYATGAARRLDAALLALYVQPVLPAGFDEERAVEQFTSDQADLVAVLRAEVVASCSAAQVRHAFVTLRGEPCTELRRLAADADVDAVLVGAAMHARHRFLPSVGTRLVRVARCPVTVVP